MSKKKANYVQFGWVRPDGSISWDRDEILNNVRRVVRQFKNSDYFLKSFDQEIEKLFKLKRKRK